MYEKRWIIFNSQETQDMLHIVDTGEIFVKGRLALTDVEVVNALIDFLRKQGHLK